MGTRKHDKEAVLVSGASGFLGGHVVKQLLEKEFFVIATVRSEQAGKVLKSELANIDDFTYELVQLSDKLSFDKVFIKHPNISKIIHTAAPFDFRVPNLRKDVIEATVEGTRNLLASTLENAPNVTHIVNTSNLISHFTLDQYSNTALILNEKCWCNYSFEEGIQNPFKASHYSKANAEKVFWEFISSHKDRFTGSSVSPGFMFGPQPFDQYVLKSSLNTSSELINEVLNLGPEDLDHLPNLFGYLTDVRDVARLQISTFTNESTHNKRLVPVSGQFSMHGILNFAKDRFPKISKQLPPRARVEIKLFQIDDSATREVLDFPLTLGEVTIYDSIKQILQVKNRL
ncbi:nucleoside-diphosphate-sugar epimerase [Yamadazyma tenuis]|uniref:NAD(P)-binding protein n=1 Tax=Candida tenuis (strain ATCC 10573 / BCRC 21748 / CBS 615 / JCM 9827 / NBRC 10315 / NRRL Y-1498 / VKM Y-70) TaxID=590646 RepID=G3AYC2_CANTC|nr:NAD(P)-binding protein [Yamadazyma tenuis ATCC 10573]XP_006684767.1 uncharacterized protein CANTEDRAFT_112681 [Yamadazyma tenuis ATCC 10573]EGV66192.1 NAD(P)-binding protein [Yamadazyma tenuis ATCC 10573]EGV66193.1 hypothetical protein CANTEDRAFT_112681 [Yamadazyma tenuis ATCC 10573]WEJ95852.1 nucleoside-diphosphate-sugar epimerase [Yamadazyma tenuis]